MSASFRSILQQVTQEKLEELKVRAMQINILHKKCSRQVERIIFFVFEAYFC